MIKFIRVQAHVTIQDECRAGFQSVGVPLSGPMDEESFTYANLAVGNMPGASSFEIGQGIVEFEIENALMSFSGRGRQVYIDESILKINSPVLIKERSRIKLISNKNSSWTYLAIAGGIEIPVVLNSRSTYIQSGFGGHKGRLIKKDDALEFGMLTKVSKSIIASMKVNHTSTVNWSIGNYRSNNSPIKVMAGPEWGWLSESEQRKILNSEFKISKEISRMGYRLEGNKINKKKKSELISSGVTAGTIQLTNEGQLIILMADSQTTGGYPRVLQVCQVDIGKVAQATPGKSIQFDLISNAEAERLFLSRASDFKKVKESIRIRYL